MVCQCYHRCVWNCNTVLSINIICDQTNINQVYCKLTFNINVCTLKKLLRLSHTIFIPTTLLRTRTHTNSRSRIYGHYNTHTEHIILKRNVVFFGYEFWCRMNLMRVYMSKRTFLYRRLFTAKNLTLHLVFRWMCICVYTGWECMLAPSKTTPLYHSSRWLWVVASTNERTLRHV